MGLLVHITTIITGDLNYFYIKLCYKNYLLLNLIVSVILAAFAALTALTALTAVLLLL